METITVLLLAKVLIVDETGKILVMQRSRNDEWAALRWDLPGGTVEHDEDPTEAAIRELQEEASITMDAVDVLYVATQHGPYIVTLVYTATIKDAVVQLSHEHEQYKWVTFQELSTLDISEKYVKAAALLTKRRRQ